MLKKFSLWLPPIAWAALIFYLSSSPLPNVSGTYWGDFVFKKTSHLFFYGALGLFLYRAFKGSDYSVKKAIVLAIVFSFLYGVSDEIHQSLVPGREPTFRDIIFDTIGASLAVLVTDKLKIV